MRSKVWVPRQALGNGDLPPVCVRTGRPADGLVSVRFRPVPRWVWVLILFGFLPFLIAVFLAGDTIVGEVPVTREVVARHHRRVRFATGLTAAAALIAAGGAVASLPAVTWLGVGLGIAAAAVYALAMATWINARTDPTGLWVLLSGVDAAFVDATVAMEEVPA